MSQDNNMGLVITKDSLEELKEAYSTATREDLEVFTFQNVTLHTGYVKYLIEYCELRKDKL